MTNLDNATNEQQNTNDGQESAEQLIADWLDTPNTRRRDQSELVTGLFKVMKMSEAKAWDIVTRCAMQAQADTRVSFGTLLAEQTAIELAAHPPSTGPVDFSRGKARLWAAYLAHLDR